MTVVNLKTVPTPQQKQKMTPQILRRTGKNGQFPQEEMQTSPRNAPFSERLSPPLGLSLSPSWSLLTLAPASCRFFGWFFKSTLKTLSGLWWFDCILPLDVHLTLLPKRNFKYEQQNIFPSKDGGETLAPLGHTALEVGVGVKLD